MTVCLSLTPNDICSPLITPSHPFVSNWLHFVFCKVAAYRNRLWLRVSFRLSFHFV